MNKEILGLERHLYAPELNSLHFMDGAEVSTPQCITIAEAVEYIKSKQS